MRVRQLYGSRAGEIVEMPYAIAHRALRSGTVEDPDPSPPVPVTGLAVADATQAVPEPMRRTAVDPSVRTPRRARPLSR
jgi:hypothetical protein